MSGPDYTLTPNLRLFKPNYDMDDGQWGYHLNTNADVLDSALSTGAGGMFLPLSGGTVTGPLTLASPLTINATYALTAASPIGPVSIWENVNASGVAPANFQPFNKIGISDTVDIQTNNTDGSACALWVIHNISGGATGARVALNAQCNITGPVASVGNNQWYTGFQAYAGSSYNAGGTVAQSGGALVAYSAQTDFNAGATHYTMGEGWETGVTVASGASVDYVNGGKIVTTGQGRLATNILALATALGTAGTQAKMGIAFQALETPYWPIDPSGTLIGTQQPGGAVQTAALGVDFSAVTFSTGAFKSNGFLVDGSGNLTAGAATFNNSLTIANNQQFAMLDNGGSPITFSVATDNHMLWYGTSSTGAQRLMMEMFQRSDTSSMNWQLPTTFVGGATFNSTLSTSGTATFDGAFIFGAGIGGPAMVLNGGNSGTSGGPKISFQFAGTTRADLGGYSSVTSGAFDYRLTLSSFDGLVFRAQNLDRMFITSTGLGFNGTAAVAKPTVSGAKGSNAALASLLTALAAYGLVTDSSTA